MLLSLTVSCLSATFLLYADHVTLPDWKHSLFIRNMSGCACFTNCNGNSGGGEATAAYALRAPCPGKWPQWPPCRRNPTVTFSLQSVTVTVNFTIDGMYMLLSKISLRSKAAYRNHPYSIVHFVSIGTGSCQNHQERRGFHFICVNF